MFNLGSFLSQIGGSMSPEKKKRYPVQPGEYNPGLDDVADVPDQPPAGKYSGLVNSLDQLPANGAGQPPADDMQSMWKSLGAGAGTGSEDPTMASRPRVVDQPPQTMTPSTDEPLTGSRKYLKEIEDTKAAPTKHENSFWKRLGSGIVKGAKEWQASGGQGGIGGLVGAIGVGGVTGAASPGVLGRWGRDQKVQELETKYANETALEGVERKRDQDIFRTDKAQSEANQQAAKPYMDAALKKGYLTDEEVDHIKRIYHIDITDPNDGRFVTEKRNGKTYIRRVNDPRSVVDPTLPVEMTEQPYNAQVPGQPGVTVPARPGQVLSTAVGVAQANAGRTERAGVRQEKQEADAAKLTRDSATKRSAANATIAKSQTTLEGLQKTHDDLAAGGYATDQVDAKIAAEKGNIAGAQQTIADLDKADKAATTKTKTSATYTEDEARAHYKKQGKSDEEINSLIQKGRAKGVIK
jgi:hypothetical protein